MSDWTALDESTGIESVAAGCDLEMPGPTRWRGEHLLKAVQDGRISPNDVKRAATNILRLVDRTKGLATLAISPGERSDDNEVLRKLIRKAAADGIVLLKNDDNILPIRKANKIAVIGPNADRSIAVGGGSAKVTPYYLVSPLDGIKAATNATVTFAKGCDTAKWLPLASPFCKTAQGEAGATIEYYKGDHFEGQPLSVQTKASTDLYLWDSAPKSVLPDYSFKVKTILTPKTTGLHTFSFSSVGPGQLLINGELFIDNWDWTKEGEAMFDNSEDVLKAIRLEAGVSVELLVESTSELRPKSKISPHASHGYGGCRIGYQEEATIDLLDEAVAIASAADFAIIMVGLDNEWESEGYDRQTMDLPKDGSQDALIEAVLKANPKTVIVNQSGSPVTMPWADEAPAIVQAWYQGQEAGNALADVLFGKCSPSGKLPTTFPKRLEDNPAYGNWPGENLKVNYEEGIFVGYRHYERAQIQPQFCFGHGLTYTRFEYSDARIDKPVLTKEGPLTISVTVANTGQMAAHEVVHVYVRDVESRLPRPEKELQAFKKVFVEPGRKESVTMEIDKYSVGYYDDDLRSWVAEEGLFKVLIGASSVDIR